MGWTEGFIAVDWGTTNRRAYLIGSDGRLRDEMEDDQGILALCEERFPAAVSQLRERFGNLPLLMAGMIGSNRGWVEVPYVASPAGAQDLISRLQWVTPGSIAIVPGVSHRDADSADVMRGEEVQIIGAVAAGLAPADCLVCHPGTHNKWVEVKGGRITSFRTVMTGELFSLLKKHSILADLLSLPASADGSFEAGVLHSLQNDDLTAELFSVRARVLLGVAVRESAASYISGLLIGADLKTGLRLAPQGRIIVMGRPELTSLFAAAITTAGREAVEVDGEEAFLAGARHLAERIQ